jgi:glycosyltransferase involved in cell wall biosynthesis
MSASLRILHICGFFHPDYGGGAAQTTREIARLQAASSHLVWVLCGTIGKGGVPYSFVEETDGIVKVLRVTFPESFAQDPEGFHLSWSKARRHERQVAELVRSVLEYIQPDVVDYHVSRELGEEALFALDRARAPVVASLHDFWLICPRVVFMRSPSNEPCTGPGSGRCLFCMYSHYDVSGWKATAKLIWRVPKLGLGVARKVLRRRVAVSTIKVAMARSGALADAHAPFIKGFCAPIIPGIASKDEVQDPGPPREGPVRFGFFGGSAKEKGLADVLRAADRLVEDGLSFEVHVFGPGQVDTRAYLVEHGRFSSGEQWTAYQFVDVAVMATRMVEPRGRIPEEASLRGIPSIAPRIGGLMDVVRDEVDGLLYRFRAVDDLERQMRRIIVDPSLLQRLRRGLRPPPDLRDALVSIEMAYHAAILFRSPPE